MIVIESINNIGLTVSDMERSVKFYRELFDFEILDKYTTPEQTILRMGDIILTLQQSDGFTASPDSKACFSFYIDEEDFDDAVEELEDSEIEIVYGPENIRKGKTVIFADPDQNKIELSYPRID